MTRDEQLKFCRVCSNQTFDLQQGIICKLTNKIADFTGNCPSYIEDAVFKKRYDTEIIDHSIEVKTAGKGKRFANYIIDIVFYLMFSYVFGFFLGIFLVLFYPSTFRILEEDNILINYLLGFISGMIYYSFLEALTGRTIAKYITRTKVVTENGERPDWYAIFIRSLCRFIPFEAFSFLGDDESGWHDRFSKTKVVNV